MTRFTLLVLFLLPLYSISAQSVEGYVKKGIDLHDAGDYADAIAAYQQALDIDAKSGLANYELANTYFATGDYKNALKYSSKSLKDKSMPGTSATIIKGSALDMLGRTEKSIKFMEAAMADLPPHYLLHYNVALNYHKLGDYANASRHCEQAVLNNTSHSSSHYLLGIAEALRSHTTQSLLAGYFFLLLEPNSPRAENIYGAMKPRLVPKPAAKGAGSKINLFLNTESAYPAIDLLVGTFGMVGKQDGDTDLTDAEWFAKRTGMLFNMLKEQEDNSGTGVWEQLYAPFFARLGKSEHVATFCHFISQGSSEESALWIDENQEALRALSEWMEE